MKNKDFVSAIMWVDYEEFHPETYKGINITGILGVEIKSYTGDFETDYNACSKQAAKYVKKFIHSSSVDNWYMDKDIDPNCNHTWNEDGICLKCSMAWEMLDEYVK